MFHFISTIKQDLNYTIFNQVNFIATVRLFLIMAQQKCILHITGIKPTVFINLL